MKGEYIWLSAPLSFPATAHSFHPSVLCCATPVNIRVCRLVFLLYPLQQIQTFGEHELSPFSYSYSKGVIL